jgi:hypothetical protein
MRELARRLGVGRSLYHLWYRPVGVLKRSIAAGGPLQQWRDRAGDRAMEAAALQLASCPEAPAPGMPELHFLTGRRFWHQTAFCLYTLQRHSGAVFHVHFHDDGSLEPRQADQLRTIFPASEVMFRGDSDGRVASLLPPDRFPTLHAERRRPYPNFLKLTDVHAGRSGWRLVLDSDMLFFRRPDQLLDWLAAPRRPLHMLDIGDAYGYPLASMNELAGANVRPRINVGFCGLDSTAIDWERLEYWARTLIARHGSGYYLEQALSAMLCAGSDPLALPARDYVVFPSAQECEAPAAVLHHYVAGSKREYFRHAWRNAAGRMTEADRAPSP